MWWSAHELLPHPPHAKSDPPPTAHGRKYEPESGIPWQLSQELSAGNPACPLQRLAQQSSWDLPPCRPLAGGISVQGRLSSETDLTFVQNLNSCPKCWLAYSFLPSFKCVVCYGMTLFGFWCLLSQYLCSCSCITFFMA